MTISKGGSFARYYIDWELQLNWEDDGREIKEHVAAYRGGKGWGYHWAAALNGYTQYFRPGLTWPRRSQKGLSVRILPGQAIFGDKGPTIFAPNDDNEQLLKLLALTNSSAFFELVRLQMAFGSYEVGVLERTPVAREALHPDSALLELARRAWSLTRTLDTVEEGSHAFLLPAALRARLGDYNPPAIKCELTEIQSKIDAIAFDLYGFTEADRKAALGHSSVDEVPENDSEEDEGEDVKPEASTVDALLSWAIGVVFGRFDWRLATGERAAPAEPEPFEPLPAKSPGMLPDRAAPFHAHEGILVDDQGHPHDLARLTEEVLARVDVTVPDDVRRWLQRDFFAFHLQRYSKSRRKAPIYWPLTTTSGSYTLWVYYPSLTSQTLYTAINDFVEPKLKQVGADVTALRNKGLARTRDDEKQFEALQAFELELIELRDNLLKLAPTYKPNHDDGVQISAAPLWPLFRHKPWQKVLKDTWTKLEKGDHDWAHLAMNYWPERVCEKCKTDKSLAIARGLEDLYVEPEAAPKKPRGKKNAGSDE
ncbi:BREX-1 system adenine-specific DNA-methyltransferase PglX [Burkholderia sp. Bp8998]|uniref:BREX-1 system adenine-specific DNA-methyltransferase PglX n=1 Tax=Burkholderia sp. Bp8998 TaxID=2184557 RepID=UPI0021AB3453|nr:BREX-1 system adenine-specific DNA-methyltransferase PglX [Burkholderia sp. Bp8998]